MDIRIKALAVHLLTATGAVFAMLAMLEAVNEKWDMMFVWLVVAFFVDGIDGPLARRYDVKTNAPLFDGVLLDLIIDYLTYVFIPCLCALCQWPIGRAGPAGWQSLSSPLQARCISQTSA
jgi:phosphatidylcholine synthase